MEGPYVQKSFDTHRLADELNAIHKTHDLIAVLGSIPGKDMNNGTSNGFISARTEVLLKKK